MKTQNEKFDLLTVGQKKAVALLQFNNEDYFILQDKNSGMVNPIIFAIDEDVARQEYEQYCLELQTNANTPGFADYCQTNYSEIADIDEDEEVHGYMVLTDEEADEKWEQALDNYLEECIYPELPNNLSNYFDDEKWKRDARIDGRGHSIGLYDGEENYETVGDTTFYIYRMN